MRCLLGAMLVVVLGACTPTHLELARRHHDAAQDAQAEGDAVRARTAYEEAAREARASIAAEEEGARAPQAWLLLAWAQLALGRLADAEVALRAVRQAGLEPARPWQRRVLVAAHCLLAAEKAWHHYAALCNDHLLLAADDATAGLRAFAAEGLANAEARRKPGYTGLVGYGAPLFQRLLGAARAHPLEGDLLVILAKRLALSCGDAAFMRQLEGWRRFQLDLLEAAVSLDHFTTDDRRRTAREALARARERPLCPRAESAVAP